LAEKFRLIDDKIKKLLLVEKVDRVFLFLIENISINYKSLKKNQYYYEEYNLLKLCEDNLWNDI